MPKPSTFQIYLKKLRGLFWEWQGIKSGGEAVNSHASSEKKANVLVSMTLIVAIGFGAGWLIKGCHDDGDFRTQAVALTTNASTIASLETENGQLHGHIDELKNALANRDGTIRDLKAKVELTPDEQKQWTRAAEAFEQARIYRDQKTNWSESAKAFEEAYVIALPVALRHPDLCYWPGHMAASLEVPYQKLGRPLDAVAAGDAGLVLQNLPRPDFVSGSTSPAIYPAIDLYNKLSKQHSPDF